MEKIHSLTHTNMTFTCYIYLYLCKHMYVWLVMDIKHNLLAYESSLSDGESQQAQNLGTWAETYISIFRLNNSFLWEVSIFVLTAFNWVSKTSLNIKVNLFCFGFYMISAMLGCGQSSVTLCWKYKVTEVFLITSHMLINKLIINLSNWLFLGSSET